MMLCRCMLLLLLHSTIFSLYVSLLAGALLIGTLTFIYGYIFNRRHIDDVMIVVDRCTIRGRRMYQTFLPS